jgi:hypothetical protein
MPVYTLNQTNGLFILLTLKVAMHRTLVFYFFLCQTILLVERRALPLSGLNIYIQSHALNQGYWETEYRFQRQKVKIQLRMSMMGNCIKIFQVQVDFFLVLQTFRFLVTLMACHWFVPLAMVYGLYFGWSMNFLLCKGK